MFTSTLAAGYVLKLSKSDVPLALCFKLMTHTQETTLWCYVVRVITCPNPSAPQRFRYPGLIEQRRYSCMYNELNSEKFSIFNMQSFVIIIDAAMS